METQLNNISITYSKKINEWNVYNIRRENKKIYFESPYMFVPFGIEKGYGKDQYILKLQFQGVKNNIKDIVDFHKLIGNFENKIMELNSINRNIFKSQIQTSKNNYDDLLIFKININKNTLNIVDKHNDIKNIFDVKQKCRIKCFFHSNELWSKSNMNVSTFSLDKIIIDEE